MGASLRRSEMMLQPGRTHLLQPFILNGPEVGKLYVSEDPQHFVFYPDADLRKLASMRKIDAVTLPQFPVSIENGYF